MKQNMFVVTTPYHVRVAFELITGTFAHDDNIIVCASSLADGALSLFEKGFQSGHGPSIVKAEYSKGGRFPRRSTVLLLASMTLANIGILFDPRIRSIARYDPQRLIIFSPNALCLLIRSLYPNADVYLGEDGIGSYNGTILDRTFYLDNKQASRKVGFLLRIATGANKRHRHNSLLLKPQGIYLHYPSLITFDYSFPVLGIVVGCNTASPSTDLKDDRWRVIFLGQSVNDASRENARRDEVLFEPAKAIPGIVYRKHPRDTRSYGDRLLDRIKDWEAYCGSIDSERTVLISDASTASVIPKLMYDKEPFLVFLHYAATGQKSQDNQAVENFLEKFRETYSDKSRIIMPTSMSEYDAVCRQINAYISGIPR